VLVDHRSLFFTATSLPIASNLQQQWSLLNRFFTAQGHCGVSRKSCGETQAMSHVVASCQLMKLDGGLSRLHSADDDEVQWLANLGR